MLFKPNGSANPTSTGPTQPAAAASYGFNNLALWDDFTSLSTIDINNTLLPGYKWYVTMHQGIGNPNVAATGISSNGVVVSTPGMFSVNNSILTITPGATNFAFLVQTGYIQGLSPSQVGSAIMAGTKGAYWECKMAFNPAYATPGQSWPSFWTWDNQITLNNANNATYSARYTELNHMEPITQSQGVIQMAYTDWDWPGTTGFISNSNNVFTVSPNLSDGNYHTYGTLYIPPIKNGGTGLIQRWIDGVHYPAGDVSFSSTTISPQANGGATTGWLSGYSNLGFSTMLDAPPGWPINVDWVQVWTS